MTSQIRVDEITNRSGLGTVTIYDNGFEFTGVTTFTEDVDITGGLTIGGVLTYEDVTNIDSVGVVTARAGINISGGNLQVDGTTVINSGRALYNLEQIKLADTKELVLGSGNDLKIHHSGSHSFISQEGVGALKIKGDDIRFEDAGGTEALRIDDVGRLLIGRTSVLASSAERLTINDGMAMFRRNNSNAAAVYIRNEDSTADTRQPYLIFTDGSGNRGGFGVQYNESSLWISGQNGIAFRTSGSAPSTTERVRIDVNGNLQVSTGQFTVGTTASTGLQLINDGTFGTIHSADLKIRTASTERLRINSAGQMILGTASNLGSVPPKLTIVNNTNSSTFSACQLLRLNGPSGVGERGGIGFHYAQSLDYGEKPSSFIGVETVAAGGAQQTDLLFATRPNTNDVEPTERLRITSTGNIGLQGNTAPLAKVHIGTLNNSALSVQTLFVEGAKTGYANYTGLPQNQLCLYDTTTSTAGSGGAISFAADCGGGQQTWIAAIESQRDSGTNDASNYAGSIVFWTRPAQSTPTEKLRILSSGGITFNGDTTAANALDDYEEGTFTPTEASGAGLTLANAAGVYTKVGRIVHVQVRVKYPTTSNTSYASIGGFPFTATNQGTNISNGSNASGFGYFTGSNIPQIHMSASGTHTNFYYLSTIQRNNNLSGIELRFGIVYSAA